MMLGTVKEIQRVNEEYLKLAIEDENAALILKKNEQYKHSIYFFIQAIL